jgi:hypothetical protein
MTSWPDHLPSGNLLRQYLVAGSEIERHIKLNGGGDSVAEVAMKCENIMHIARPKFGGRSRFFQAVNAGYQNDPAIVAAHNQKRF